MKIRRASSNRSNNTRCCLKVQSIFSINQSQTPHSFNAPDLSCTGDEWSPVKDHLHNRVSNAADSC